MPNNDTPSHDESWEAVIGLEIHALLKTKSKLFCQAPNRFGDEPNVNIDVLSTGQPGALPKVNKEAIRLAALAGFAVDGTVATMSRFERKSYMYPDLPRNYQITQSEFPIVIGGTIEVVLADGTSKNFAINHIHIEDDAGNLKHFESFSGVDDNRAGAPLIETVTEPCIHSPQEAVALLQSFRALLQSVGVSDCALEEGGMRFDCNVSVRKRGEKTLRPKIEIKNLNSFYAVEKALSLLVEKQIAHYTRSEGSSEGLQLGTYRFDAATESVEFMRKKESVGDYCLITDPDLPPVFLAPELLETWKQSVNKENLPNARYRRLIKDLPHDIALTVSYDKKLANYFEEALSVAPFPKKVYNWIAVEFTGRLAPLGKSTLDCIPAVHIAALVNMLERQEITGKIAKSVADDMVACSEKSPEAIVAENPDYKPMRDHEKTEAMVLEVLANNQGSVDTIKQGHYRAFGFLVGQVMKLSRGQASPELVNSILIDKLNQLFDVPFEAMKPPCK